MVIADIEKPKFISKDQIKTAIKKSSKLLGFNYEYIYYGRKYFDKLEMIPYIELKKAIEKRLDFLKPGTVFIPYSGYNASTIRLNTVVRSISCFREISLLEYGDLDSCNLRYDLEYKKAEIVGKKCMALSYFDEYTEGITVDSIERFNILKMYRSSL